MKNVYEIGENKWNIFSELVQVHKTDASMYAHLFIYLVRELLLSKKKTKSATALSVSEFVVRTTATFF